MINATEISSGLFVGGRVPEEHVEHLARELRVRAVIDLRLEDCDDAELLRRHELLFLHLPTEDNCAVTARMLQDGVTFANRHLDGGERVLIHCQHGIGRSATLALCVMVSRGMTPLEALELAKNKRPIVSPSPPQYEAWASWLREWKQTHNAGWQVPHFDEFKAIAYRHLPSGPR